MWPSQSEGGVGAGIGAGFGFGVGFGVGGGATGAGMGKVGDTVGGDIGLGVGLAPAVLEVPVVAADVLLVPVVAVVAELDGSLSSANSSSVSTQPEKSCALTSRLSAASNRPLDKATDAPTYPA